MRISTNMSVYEFTEKWSNQKYNKKTQSPFSKWMSIKPAEMQKSDIAFPIGYFAGTSERGDYDTIAQNISKHTGVKAEISYQIVRQRGVSNEIWNFATEAALKDFPNPASKEHKRVKFSNAPLALVIYVGEKKSNKTS